MYHHGSTCGSLFLTGYVLEKTLSVDNLMVFIAIFKFFNIRDVLQHKILYWGILGAIVFRGVFVGLGKSFIDVRRNCLYRLWFARRICSWS